MFLSGGTMSLYLIAICCGLTALEMVAAYFAKKTGVVWNLTGVSTFVALFFLYKFSLTVGSLTLVTVGWIFTSQIAAVGYDYWVNNIIANKYQLIGIGVVMAGVAIMCIPAGNNG
jgi:hypothetical protein